MKAVAIGEESVGAEAHPAKITNKDFKQKNVFDKATTGFGPAYRSR